MQAAHEFRLLAAMRARLHESTHVRSPSALASVRRLSTWAPLKLISPGKASCSPTVALSRLIQPDRLSTLLATTRTSAGDEVGEGDVVGRHERAAIAMAVRLGDGQREGAEHAMVVGVPASERPPADVVDETLRVVPARMHVAAVRQLRRQPVDALAQRLPQRVPRPSHGCERVHPELG